jgi:hypothetical protein
MAPLSAGRFIRAGSGAIPEGAKLVGVGTILEVLG